MSSSLSAENLTSNSDQSNDSSTMCLELALEGERLCKSGDCRAGVAFFQAAIQAGTDDLRTLSAIYSQLGNAYFYLGDYTKAMEYHQLDLTLARSMDDKLGEAKSSGNLGNTLKVMARFDEAAIHCQCHLTLAQELGDRLSEGRALYNLGNVYHAKGKHMGQTDPGDFSEDVQEVLLKAVNYYQQNLILMKELGDRGAQGRACGNLGNTYYLLGDFEAAIEHHQERLRIAREFGDKAAERRANSNLGNSHIFLGQFEQAAVHYKRTLSLAVDLNERAVEAQSCYSLGNTYTLLNDFQTAIDYHLKHLEIAQELGDKVGETRACLSLGNAHSSIGSHETALNYAQLHYSLAKELGDSIGEATARMNVSDLRKILGLPDFMPSSDSDLSNRSPVSMCSDPIISSTNANKYANSRILRVRRQSMEQLDLIKLTPDGKRIQNNVQTDNLIDPLLNNNNNNVQNKTKKLTEDDFFEMLTKSQSKRMDDQRCSLKLIGSGGGGAGIGGINNRKDIRKPLMEQNNKISIDTVSNSDTRSGISSICTNSDDIGGGDEVVIEGATGITETVSSTTGSNVIVKENRNALIEMIADLQSERMNEQRAQLPGLREVLTPNNIHNNNNNNNNNNSLDNNINNNNNNNITQQPRRAQRAPDDAFLDMLMRSQSARIEEQRTELPNVVNNRIDNETTNRNRGRTNNIGATVPDEDFFSLIMRVQGGRMDDQRAAIPFQPRNNNISSSSTASTVQNNGVLPKKSK